MTTVIDALPIAPDLADPGTFSDRVDAFIRAWATARTQFNALAGELTALAADQTAGFEAAVEDLNALAATFALSTTATSSTSLSLGIGTKSLTVQAGKGFAAGMYVSIAYTTAPNARMTGVVQSYNSASGVLVVATDTVTGSGTQTAWTIAPSAVGGSSTGLSFGVMLAFAI